MSVDSVTSDSVLVRFDQKLPSDPDVIVPFIDEVEAAIKPHLLSPRDFFWIRFALEEVLVNAIKHGNLEDAPQPTLQMTQRVVDVRVSLRTCIPELMEHFGKEEMIHGSVDMSVHDEGRGFEPKDVPDPTSDEYIEIASGKGTFVTRERMDEYRVESMPHSGLGTTVHMKRKVALKQPNGQVL